ncbi:MAG: ribonuclease HII [Leptospiraceae bacterium]|nr:ribonuclease HII [Leptospiraceae bacterium]MDW7975721.1 ribonuclease HII [Leptospiraceae bacterium]
MNFHSQLTFSFEKSFFEQYDIVIGIDEAGRGAIAGPVFIGGVGFSKSFFEKPDFDWVSKVRDSKKLTPSKREELYEKIKKTAFFSKSYSVSSDYIDQNGINSAIEKGILFLINDVIELDDIINIKFLIDGNYRFSFGKLHEDLESLRISQTKLVNEINLELYKNTKTYRISISNIIKGDDKVFSIASASILAKVSRDLWMMELAKQYPQYGFERHKGYGTKSHFEKIRIHGICEFHRKSFLGSFKAY